ncbi:MAG: inositol monophosphatase [Planctomycetaceae bacterium]|jgi:myo-inositol-1(or 4)-monophosphatase|nr:inositol monophosphatase [Planctomycetaceae bacterium]
MNSHYLSICEKASYAAGAVLREKLGSVTVRSKSNRFDLVTEADIAAQKIIEQIIFDAFPEHQFIGEEGNLTQSQTKTQSRTQSGNTPKSNFTWIVDPLDGTTNYVHGLPFFATSIALVQNNSIICGAIYNPITNEYFCAERGQGAFLNGQQIHVSSCCSLEEALVSVGFPTLISPESLEVQLFLNACHQCQSIRRTGSTALNLAYIASGRFDAGWACKCHAWDIAAGVILVNEAGGKITQPDGQPININSGPTPFCAAANENLYKLVIKNIIDRK